jgi:hypothetical protein
MTKIGKLILTTLLFVLVLGGTAFAHQPVIKVPGNEQPTKEFGMATRVKDATKESQAIYGALTSPGQTDIYYFVAGADAVIPVEVLVPVRYSNMRFAPAVIIIGKNITGRAKNSPISLPSDLGARLVSPPTERRATFEPFSEELLYSGNPVKISVKKGNTYYFIVYDPKDYIGDYSLAIGDKESFSGATVAGLFTSIFDIKLRLIGGWDIPWLDILGLFAMMGGIICALGSVMVVTVEALRGRHSEEWAHTAMMTIQATAPVMWLGFFAATLGGLVLYRTSAFTGVGFFQFIIAIIIAINSAYLWFVIRPKFAEHGATLFKRSIAVCLILSFVLWWLQAFLLVWYLLVTR